MGKLPNKIPGATGRLAKMAPAAVNKAAQKFARTGKEPFRGFVESLKKAGARAHEQAEARDRRAVTRDAIKFASTGREPFPGFAKHLAQRAESDRRDTQRADDARVRHIRAARIESKLNPSAYEGIRADNRGGGGGSGHHSEDQPRDDQGQWV